MHNIRITEKDVLDEKFVKGLSYILGASYSYLEAGVCLDLYKLSKDKAIDVIYKLHNEDRNSFGVISKFKIPFDNYDDFFQFAAQDKRYKTVFIDKDFKSKLEFVIPTYTHVRITDKYFTVENIKSFDGVNEKENNKSYIVDLSSISDECFSRSINDKLGALLKSGSVKSIRLSANQIDLLVKSDLPSDLKQELSNSNSKLYKKCIYYKFESGKRVKFVHKPPKVKKNVYYEETIIKEPNSFNQYYRNSISKDVTIKYGDSLDNVIGSTIAYIEQKLLTEDKEELITNILEELKSIQKDSKTSSKDKALFVLTCVDELSKKIDLDAIEEKYNTNDESSKSDKAIDVNSSNRHYSWRKIQNKIIALIFGESVVIDRTINRLNKLKK